MKVIQPYKTIKDRREEAERRKNLLMVLGACGMVLAGLVLFLYKYNLYIHLIQTTK